MASAGKPTKGNTAAIAKTGPIRGSEQQTQLDFELEFFEQILQRNPDFLDALRVHGNNLTLKGRYADGLKIDRRLVELRPQDALAHYNLACSYSLMRKVDPALRALRKAIELGYDDFQYMIDDRDLEAVKEDPRFQNLLREYEIAQQDDPPPNMAQPLFQGDGPLFADPSANRAREFFRQKPRALADKVTTVKDAVARLVQDGDYLAIGGFGGARFPSAVCHEIVRQKKQNLTLAGHTATHDFQILAAGNLTGHGKLIARVDIAYVVGLEARGLSPHGRRVIESGEVETTEWSNYALAVRFKAAAMGLPFLPGRSMLGTDTFRESPTKEIECPYTGEKLLAIPALYPDIGVIHVHEADRFGNCRIRGTTVADPDLARASKKLIITCERLIPNDEIRSDPTRTLIPFYCVDAVCEVPFGSYPGNMPYEYFSDEDHIRRWLEVEGAPAEHQKFIDQNIYGVADFNEYLQRCGGLARMQRLRQEEFLLHRGK